MGRPRVSNCRLGACIGIATTCPQCKAANWDSWTGTDYQLDCERCLKSYDFPQADRAVWPLSLIATGKCWVSHASDISRTPPVERQLAYETTCP